MPRGLCQSFSTKKENPINLNLLKEDILGNETNYPLIIHLESLNNSKKSRATSQTTFASISKSSEDIYDIKTIKQKVEYRGVSYWLHDIYGSDEQQEDTSDCVICLTEPRSTIIIPCRHMCLCHQCAESLRDKSSKCPICRAPVRSLLKLEISQVGSVDGLVKSEENSSEVTLTKSKGQTQIQSNSTPSNES
eukprot:TRINITY_DN13162_c0_g1_i1.p1 TRINITY_DN13162_c0_g1~~TRINITY_DN13162_c0_g1_i1.p1  ORF type:complete len:205 (+),score=24.95 TRINITY_DN13162_c0_g1_i1:42-617(+)